MDGLTLDGLAHRYGRRRLFDSVAAHAGPGEWLAVTGRNGSGKTTLIRILAGLLRPSRGTARLVRSGRLLDQSERRRAVGLVTPDMSVDLDLTVRENLEFAARLRGVGTPTGPLLERIGLGERSDDRARTLSSGLRQRLKLALALHAEPYLLLLDEPASALDSEGRGLMPWIRRTQLERGVLVIATNDPLEAEGTPHQIVLTPAESAA